MAHGKRGWAARRVDDLIDWIAERKGGMLAFSIVATATLGLGAGVAIGAGAGGPLTSGVTATGGYIAILALVLGFPALCYAMVTDRSVDALSAATRENLRDNVLQVLIDGAEELLQPDHHVQLFRPNHRKTTLMPFYDPAGAGPTEGWSIDPSRPQAVTGSAWVGNKYYFALGQALSDSRLRLTSEQRKRYGDLTGVAAAPVRDASGDPIAVLTIFTQSKTPQMANQDYIDRHLVLADRVSNQLRRITGPLDVDAIAEPSKVSGRDSGSIAVTDDLVADAQERMLPLDKA